MRAARRFAALRSSHSQAGSGQKSDAYLFVDSVFPIRLGRWEYVYFHFLQAASHLLRSLRHYVGLLREGSLLNNLRSSLELVHAHGFHVLSLEPRHKDGGVFVHFQYLKDDSNRALDDILIQTRHFFAENNGPPSWMGSRYAGNAWLVKGNPWREVRHRLVGWLGPESDAC